MDPVAIATVISALVAGVASVYNTVTQKQTNDENRDYADTQTTAQWERDDSSFQRQVLDAKAAGLSPLAVTGYAPSSAPVTAMAQAPQMDLSSLIGSISNMGSYELGKAQLSESKRQFNENIALETYKAKEAVDQLQQQIDQTALEHKDQIKQFAASLEYQYTLLNDQIDTHNADQEAIYSLEFQKEMARASEESLKTYEALCNTLQITPPVEYYTNYDNYIKALNSYPVDWSKQLFKSDSSTTGYTYAEGNSSSVNAGFTVAGTGGNAGGSNSENASYSSTKSDDYFRSNSASVLPTDPATGKIIPYPVYKHKASKVDYKSSSTKSNLHSSYSFDD